MIEIKFIICTIKSHSLSIFPISSMDSQFPSPLTSVQLWRYLWLLFSLMSLVTNFAIRYMRQLINFSLPLSLPWSVPTMVNVWMIQQLSCPPWVSPILVYLPLLDQVIFPKPTYPSFLGTKKVNIFPLHHIIILVRFQNFPLSTLSYLFKFNNVFGLYYPRSFYIHCISYIIPYFYLLRTLLASPKCLSNTPDSSPPPWVCPRWLPI